MTPDPADYILPDGLTRHPRFLRYAVDEAGTVYRLYKTRRPHALQKYPDRDGYLCTLITVDGRRLNIRIHQAVCETFHGPRPSRRHETRHLNGVRTDNRRVNVLWGTRKENAADRDAHGTTARGRRNGAYAKPRRVVRGQAHGMSKLTPADVLRIRADDRTQREIAKDFGVTQRLISMIHRGEVWAEVGGRIGRRGPLRRDTPTSYSRWKHGAPQATAQGLSK